MLDKPPQPKYGDKTKQVNVHAKTYTLIKHIANEHDMTMGSVIAMAVHRLAKFLEREQS